MYPQSIRQTNAENVIEKSDYPMSRLSIYSYRQIPYRQLKIEIQDIQGRRLLET